MGNNFFDDLNAFPDREEIAKETERRKSEAEKRDLLIHKVFSQTEDGKELLSQWREALIFTETASSGMDLIEIGLREGMKRFIRNIILTVKRLEEN